MDFELDCWVGVEEISRYLDTKPDTVRTWAKTGYIPAKKIGKAWKFKISEIDEWIETNQCDTTRQNESE